uniref:Uncharacterized protein n=1 Tax=Bracon brevicornis TaxID=1563983 RepID=A0A6V7L3M0_9HYME
MNTPNEEVREGSTEQPHTLGPSTGGEGEERSQTETEEDGDYIDISSEEDGNEPKSPKKRGRGRPKGSKNKVKKNEVKLTKKGAKKVEENRRIDNYILEGKAFCTKDKIPRSPMRETPAETNTSLNVVAQDDVFEPFDRFDPFETNEPAGSTQSRDTADNPSTQEQNSQRLNSSERRNEEELLITLDETESSAQGVEVTGGRRTRQDQRRSFNNGEEEQLRLPNDILGVKRQLDEWCEAMANHFQSEFRSFGTQLQEMMRERLNEMRAFCYQRERWEQEIERMKEEYALKERDWQEEIERLRFLGDGQEKIREEWKKAKSTLKEEQAANEALRKQVKRLEGELERAQKVNEANLRNNNVTSEERGDNWNRPRRWENFNEQYERKEKRQSERRSTRRSEKEA